MENNSVLNIYKASDFKPFLKSVLFARKRNDHEFSARLIEIREAEDLLVFQTRSGAQIVDKASSIAYFVEVGK